MTVASTRHGLSVYTGVDDDTEPTPTVGSGHRDEGPRPESGEILDQGGRPVSQNHRIGVSATTAPSTVYLKAFGPDGTVTDKNEPYRGVHANHMQDTDAASCILGSPNFACFLPSDIPRHRR